MTPAERDLVCRSIGENALSRLNQMTREERDLAIIIFTLGYAKGTEGSYPQSEIPSLALAIKDYLVSMGAS